MVSPARATKGRSETWRDAYIVCMKKRCAFDKRLNVGISPFYYLRHFVWLGLHWSSAC